MASQCTPKDYGRDFGVHQLADAYVRVRVADLVDIGCMKLDAIGSRGIRRDFIDVYFICKKTMIVLDNLIKSYCKKYKIKNTTHLIKSLTYFKDAETTPIPRMLIPFSWSEVKRFFEREVIRLVNR